MAFTYTDRNKKTVIASFGEFKAVVTEAVVVGDLVSWYDTDATSALQFADDSDSQAANAVALADIAAGAEGPFALQAVLKAPASVGTGGVVTQTHFSAAADVYGAPLYLGESGKVESSQGGSLVQLVGYNLTRDVILLQPNTALSGGAASFTTLAASGAVTHTGTTDATNSTSGILVVTGGVGIAKKLYVGTNVDVAGTLTVDGTTTIVGLVPITDPGNAGAIAVTRSGYVPLVTGGGGETRTVADPTAVGMILMLSLKTDGGGDAVVAFASPVNQTGNNRATFADVGDSQALISVEDGSDIEWREFQNDGAGLTTV